MPSILIVSSSFPPDFSVGAKRPARMARHLPALGWNVEVLALREWYFERLDRSLEPPPTAVRLDRTQALMPKAWGRRLRSALHAADDRDRPGATPAPGSARPRPGRVHLWLSETWDVFCSIPDEWTGWIPFALPGALRSARRSDLVLATLPPFTNAVVAAVASRSMRVPLVLDYRDPWSTLIRRPRVPRWRRALDRALERFCLRGASMVITTTDGLRKDLAVLDPPTTVVIPNGFDSSVFESVQPVRDRRFTIVYAGIFYGTRRVEPILEALRRLRDEGRLPARGLVLRVLGISGPEVRERAEQLGVTGLVEVEGFLPHREALAHMKGADVLLLVVGEDHGGLVPAKLFEYLAARRFILAAVPPGAEAGEVVLEAGAGRVVLAADAEALAEAIESRFSAPTGDLELRPTAARYDAGTTMRELDRVLRSVLR